MARHLFRVSKDAWDACTGAEVKATCAALQEAGLYALPFDTVDIEVPVDCAVNWSKHAEGLREVKTPEGVFIRSDFGGSVVLRIMDVSTVAGRPVKEWIVDYRTRKHFTVPAPGDKDIDRSAEDLERDRILFGDLLITLLATRNATKDTTHNKLAKLGIGKKNPAARYEYITTIRPPAAVDMPDDAEHPPTGRTVCPHLRRAHLRNQHFGPRNQYVKRVLVAAVFVNADKEWTKTRAAYNVGL